MALLTLLSTIYTQIICAAVLWYTNLHPTAIFTFLCIYYGAGPLTIAISKIPIYERPLIYSASATNIALILANISSLALSVILVVVNWKMFLIALVMAIFLGRNALKTLAEITIIWPVSFFTKRCN